VTAKNNDDANNRASIAEAKPAQEQRSIHTQPQTEQRSPSKRSRTRKNKNDKKQTKYEHGVIANDTAIVSQPQQTSRSNDETVIRLR
jgi:DNA-nicking Smr family endonuclease